MASKTFGVLKSDTKQPALDAGSGDGQQQNVTKTSLLSEALSSNPYEYDAILFPANLGTGEGLLDYVLFNINVNEGSAPKFEPTAAGVAGDSTAPKNGNTTPEQDKSDNEAGKAKDPSRLVGTKRGKITVQGELGRSSTQASFANPNRTRIKTSIALPLPVSAISATYAASWEAVNLANAGGSLDRFNAASASFKSNGSYSGAIKAGVGDGSEAAAIAGYSMAPEDLRAGLEKASGFAMNPRTEVVYRGTPNRTFQFDFKLSPASAEEAANLEKLIQVLKYAQAPELEGGFGSWLKYPDDFDIGIYYNGDRNKHVHRLSSCALISVTVDYSGGQGGMPTFKDGYAQTILLSLQFIELEMITKKRVTEGF